MAHGPNAKNGKPYSEERNYTIVVGLQEEFRDLVEGKAHRPPVAVEQAFCLEDGAAKIDVISESVPVPPPETLAPLLQAVLVMIIGFAPDVFARALYAYPLQGQSPEQQEADRAACAEWAVQQSGYSPTGLPIVVRGNRPGIVTGLIVPIPSGAGMTVALGPEGGVIGGVVSRKQLANIEVLYADYLAAGATCLTARGYQVSM